MRGRVITVEFWQHEGVGEYTDLSAHRTVWLAKSIEFFSSKQMSSIAREGLVCSKKIISLTSGDNASVRPSGVIRMCCVQYSAT